MCGISGYQMNEAAVELSTSKILDMNAVIGHRGPDDEGITFFCTQPHSILNFVSQNSARDLDLPALNRNAILPHYIAFGHRRFSIIDVSSAGHQPFWSSDRRICVSFNGEIYNYLEVRGELQALGFRFHTTSDTEVLLTAYEAWGTECFQRLNGFWALSLYDARRDAVLLARDRLGKAPLYVSRLADRLAWSSEIKGLRSLAELSEIRQHAVEEFVRHGWRDLNNETFFSDISSFPAGSFAWIENNGELFPQSYWKLSTQRVQAGELDPIEVIQRFKELLGNAVAIRMRADVPIGFELSGGMDSSALVALAAASGRSLKAYTVAFPNTGQNEEPFARAVVARHSKHIDYTVLHPPKEDFLRQADTYVALMDEPFHAPNMLTNYNVWKNMQADGIKISINGAAGDEVLAGYAEYFRPYLKHLINQGHWTSALHETLKFSELRAAPLLTIQRGLKIFSKKQVRQADHQILQLPASRNPIRGGASLEINQRLVDNVGNWRMNYWLRSGNQSAMGVPLEVRAPFLDHRIVELAFSLPLNYLIRDGWLKWILRKATQDILPAEVVWRKTKMGFPFPLSDWLAQNEAQFLAAAIKTDCPYVNLPNLRKHYRLFAQREPAYLWRLLSVVFWWQRCINKESLSFNYGKN